MKALEQKLIDSITYRAYLRKAFVLELPRSYVMAT